MLAAATCTRWVRGSSLRNTHRRGNTAPIRGRSSPAAGRNATQSPTAISTPTVADTRTSPLPSMTVHTPRATRETRPGTSAGSSSASSADCHSSSHPSEANEGTAGGLGNALADEQALEAEADRGVGYLAGGLAALEDEDAGEVVGDAEDGVGQHLGVDVANAAGDHAFLHVGDDVGDGDVLAPAQHGGEALLRHCELEEGVEVAVLGQPRHRRPHAELDALDGVDLVADGRLLAAAQAGLGILEDLEEQLFLAGE